MKVREIINELNTKKDIMVANGEWIIAEGSKEFLEERMKNGRSWSEKEAEIIYEDNSHITIKIKNNEFYKKSRAK